MLISKNHLKARFTASTDGTRPVLNTIQLSVDGDEVVAVATNGYILSEIREEVPSDDDFPKSPSMGVNQARVQATTASSVAKAIKKSKHLPILNYAHVGADGVTVTDLEHTQEFKDHPVDGNFPDYKHLIPAAEEALATVKINPEYLKTMAQLFKDEDSVTIELHGESKAMMFRSEQYDHTITGVIMPLKG